MSVFTLEPNPTPEAPAPPDPLDTLQAELADQFPPGGAPPEGAAPAAAEPAGDLLDEATCRMMLQVPFDFIAARKGAHWKLSPEELAAAVPPAIKVSNKYAPELLKRWADEIALAVILGLITMKRVNLDTEKALEKKPESSTAAPVAV